MLQVLPRACSGRVEEANGGERPKIGRPMPDAVLGHAIKIGPTYGVELIPPKTRHFSCRPEAEGEDPKQSLASEVLDEKFSSPVLNPKP